MSETAVDYGDQILTVEQVADFLKLSEATIYRMAQAGEIPAKRVGRSWRFSRAEIHHWFRSVSADKSSNTETPDRETGFVG